jgi:hypothetical protein
VCALAGAVLAHDGVHFTAINGEVDAFEDFASAGCGDAGVEIGDFE